MAGYVVTRPYPDSNVGSNLASLAGAAWLARRLERQLLVDWRSMSQLADPELNFFSEFFTAADVVAGVRARYAPSAEAGDYESLLPERATTPSGARALAGGATQPAEPIVLQAYHGLDRIHPGPESERFRLLRRFYQELRPAADLAAEIESWWTTHLAGRFVVGLNVRTGNGRYFDKGMRYARRVDVSIFDDRQRFLRTLERACRHRLRSLPRPVREGAAIFFATDSAWMSELLSTLPAAVTRRRVFPPPGTGDTYRFAESDGYSDHSAVSDSVADMFLLGRCDALVYNNSLFNQYARVLTANFSGNATHIESLFLRSRLRRTATRVHGRLGRA